MNTLLNFRLPNALLRKMQMFSICLILTLAVFAQNAPVLNPAGGFQIDGDLMSNYPVMNGGDWVPGNAGMGGHVLTSGGISLDDSSTFLLSDPFNSIADDIFSGSSLNEDPNNWKWTSGSAPAKNEIHRGMIHFSKDASGDIWLMIGSDRLSTNGTAYIDFELLQSTMTKSAVPGRFVSYGPHGGRTINDLLITVNYNNGGGVSSIIYNRWLPNGSGGYAYQPVTSIPQGYAITNETPVAVPFGAFGDTMYQKYQFAEAAVNLSEVIEIAFGNPCQGLSIKTIFIKTKASTSANAELKDFINPLQVNFAVREVILLPVSPLCVNQSPVTLQAVPAGGSFTGTGVTGNSFDPSAAGVGMHQVIYEKVLAPGCIKKDTILIEVKALPVGGVVIGSDTVCYASNSGTVTLQNQSGEIVKWQSSVNGNDWVDISNQLTGYSYSNLLASTYFRAVLSVDGCGTVTSLPALITVDPASIGGTAFGNNTVCFGTNSGKITLSGYTGVVVKWQSSVNGGSSWTDIANTTTEYQYSNLNQTTLFRAVIKSGTCEDVYSTVATVTVDPSTIGGSVAAGRSVCYGSNSGTLYLSGHTGTVVKWQLSVNNGQSWTDIANAGISLNYNNLTQSTLYRAVVKSGVCNEATSSPALIQVDPVSVGGSVNGAKTVCISGNSGTLTLSGHVGMVIKWQKSVNGNAWTDIANTSTTLSYSNLIEPTRFRAVVQSGVCDPVNSTAALIGIDPESEGGSLAGNSHVCGGSNAGNVSLSGQVGSVMTWQQSTNGGGSWSDIPGTASLSSFSYQDILTTTLYRVVVKSGSCSLAYSGTVEVEVDPATDPGVVTGPVMVCDNDAGKNLLLENYTGSVLKWQYSNDNLNWIDVDDTTATMTIGLLNQRTWFRAQVQSGMCPPEFSASFMVVVLGCGPTTSHCTYTQGFYGNEGGLGCTGGADTNRYETTKAKMLRSFDIFGKNKVVFGRENIDSIATMDRAFTLFREDVVNDNIFMMLPGGGTAMSLGIKPGGTAYGISFEGATFNDRSTWNAVPIVPSGASQGTMKNILLAQTVTLFFNMHNGTNLALAPLHDTIFVADYDCLTGAPDSGAAMMKFAFPHELIAYISNNPGAYTKNVAGLYKLANEVLGGMSVQGITPSMVNQAVDLVNRAFDECRALVGVIDVSGASGGLSSTTYSSRSTSVKTAQGISVLTYPNPFRDRVNFEVESVISGFGTLELYSISGQKIAGIYSGEFKASEKRRFHYQVPAAAKGPLVYLLRIGNKSLSGKLINPIR